MSGQAILKYRAQGPVLQQYMDAEDFVQVIRGPLGSGKTTGSAAKLFRLACRQKATKDGVRKSRWLAIRNCYDDQTEILTEARGWQLFKDLLSTDKVAMLQDGALVFAAPTYYYSEQYEGDMLAHESQMVNFCVTPDHRMYVSRATTRAKTFGPYGFALASEIEGQFDLRVKRDAAWVSPEAPPLSCDMYEWLGLWFAEGNVGETSASDGFARRRLILTQVKPDGVAYARALFHRAAVPFTESTGPFGAVRFRVQTRKSSPDQVGNCLFNALRHSGKATVKRVPAWLKRGTSEQLRAFLRGFIAGDGCVTHVTTAYTSSRLLADDLQEIALKAGLVANIASRDRVGQSMNIRGKKTSPTAREYAVTILKSRGREPRLHPRAWTRAPYSGRVYCIEVPTHIVYVRRGGRAMWCSQTYPDLKNTTIRDWRAVVPDNCGRMTMGVPPEHKLDFDLSDGTRVQSEVIFLALDRPDDVRKLRGINATGGWINEMKEVPKAILDMALGRCDRYPYPGFSSWVGIFGDTNAWDDDHWLEELDKLRLKGELPGYRFFTQPPAVIKVGDKWEVNPLAENLKVLKPDYYQRQIAGKRPAWIKVNLENRIGISFDGKPVHPDYDDTVHVAADILRPVPGIVYVGMDFGLSPAGTFWQRQATGQWWGLEEVVCYDMGAVRFADALKLKIAEMKALCPGLTFIFRGDPSGDNRVGTDESTVLQTLRLNGVPALPCSTNDPQLRRDALDRPLTRLVGGKLGMLVSPVMKVFRRGMAGGFCYKRVEVPGTEKFRDEPDKNQWSHVVESGEYALLDAGEHSNVNAAGQNFPKGPVVLQKNWNPLDS